MLFMYHFSLEVWIIEKNTMNASVKHVFFSHILLSQLVKKKLLSTHFKISSDRGRLKLGSCAVFSQFVARQFSVSWSHAPSTGSRSSISSLIYFLSNLYLASKFKNFSFILKKQINFYFEKKINFSLKIF